MLCWCLLSYSLELNLFAVPGAEGKFSFLHLFVAPFSDIFFASSCRIGRFVSGAFQGRRGWKYKVFRKNTTQRCGDFFENRRLDLLFPKPAAIPLHLHDNGWCQKERPCEGKKIRAANENRNFTEVFGLHDYRILISEKWIQLLSCKCFRKMEIAFKNGTAFREIPVKEESGLSMLLASGFLQGFAAKHESGRWGLHQWLLSCGGVCKQNCTANQGMVFILIG